jgi:beta-galactosidase GanA
MRHLYISFPRRSFNTGLLILMCSLGIVQHSSAQIKFDNILYGVSYYHEYMPEERLEKDVKLMQEACVSVVRLAESSWSGFEPQEGKFEFAWMDRIVDRLHKAGIKVIVGTPTYSIPPWLWKKHPDMLIETADGEKNRVRYSSKYRPYQSKLSHLCRTHCSKNGRTLCKTPGSSWFPGR